jgi:ABC-2 type transport system permease protein
MTDLPAGRRLSPTSQPGPGTARKVTSQIRWEVTRYRRVPEYFIGVVVLPVILFAMFGLPNTGDVLPGGTSVVAMLFVSFCCYGVVSQALFSFGPELATERQKGWLRRLRATPMPMWLYFAGKLALNLVFTAVIIAAVALLAATAGQAGFELDRLATTCAVLLLGTVAFSPTGSAIAYWARPKAVSTIVNLLFLPLAFLSGFFFPIEQLPDVLQRVAPWLPTYHFGQVAWRAMAPEEDVSRFSADAGGSLVLHVAVIVAWALLGLALTVWGYRRELDRERG